MLLADLRVVHQPKVVPGVPVGTILDAMHLDSCQRRLWLAAHEPCDVPSGAEVLRGEAAYLLLLRVATGLESRVAGETDVFGQLKEAWKKSVLAEGTRAALDPWLQRLFEDTKEIRTRFIQNTGGVSYGTLVRKLLADDGQPVLLIGAGQIARSIAPYLGTVLAWNRSLANLELFLSEHPQATAVEDIEQAWRDAAHVVIAVPPTNAALEARWIELGRARTRGKIVHLGGQRTELTPDWAKVPTFAALDDLFALESAQVELRSVQMELARKACRERAKLRALGTSVSLPHGWEDLAAFG